MNSEALNRLTLAQIIKQKAIDMGFHAVGISKAERLEDDAKRLETWLSKGYHGKMSYMANHFDKRVDPRLLVPGAKSVISFLYNYYTSDSQTDKQVPKISKYALGEDYHKIVKDKLFELLNWIKKEIGEIEGRFFVDSAPVLERSWAQKSGLGWIGKNGNLINKNAGSYFFLAELISDLNPEPDDPVPDHCGTCTRCIDACPTKAIIKPQQVDGSRCISYFTIELKDELLPDEMKGKFQNWIFGCDICQEVCPWNRFASEHREEAFRATPLVSGMNRKDWTELEEIFFDELFSTSAIKRTTYKGLMRNIRFLED